MMLIKNLLRLLGLLLLLGALAALIYDLGGFAPPSDQQFSPLGQLWFQLHPGSLNMLQAGIERNLDPDLWHETIFPILELPAVFVLALPGLVLLLLSTFVRKREKRHRLRR
ncbi:MAG: hypothetical protein P8X75_01020 [Limibacillus sp.]|jgi:hypothetical protein